MKNICAVILFCLITNYATIESYPQSNKNQATDSLIINELNKTLYSSTPNHRELVVKTLELAFNSGFIDTLGIGYEKIKDRLEAGAYSEDFEPIPGIIGEYYPDPWNQGPSYDFNTLYSFSKIPYGSYLDSLSGWRRGLFHGFDPVKGFLWPGADMTTVEWANSSRNIFAWDKALSLYKGGEKEKAYECLGHLLHLLDDLSIPAHVKIVNHGISIGSKKSGTIIDPDVLVLIIDEYELALAGGISIPNITDLIPNLLGNFRSALQTADESGIPEFAKWDDYFKELAAYTYNQATVNKFYAAPLQNGSWGSALNANGNIVEPAQYGITLQSQISGRWAQVAVKSTAGLNGTIIPSSEMINMCNDLVPKAVEYGAGLLKYFFEKITAIDSKGQIPGSYNLDQNYPNPFNPSTTISYTILKQGKVSLKVFNLLGSEVAELVNEEKGAGSYQVSFNASSLSSGVYFYRIKAGDFVQTKKMILLK